MCENAGDVEGTRGGVIGKGAGGEDGSGDVEGFGERGCPVLFTFGG